MNIRRVVIGAAAAVAALAASAGAASADGQSPVYSIFAQGHGSCVLTHEVSVQTKSAQPGRVTLTVKPRVGFAPGNAGDECQSTLPAQWKGGQGGQVNLVVKSPGRVGDQPQIFELPTGAGERELLIGDPGSPASLGVAKITVRVP